MDLHSFGWNRKWAEALASTGESLQPGRVISANRQFCRLAGAQGEVDGVLSGTLLDAPSRARPVTGDWVAFEPDCGRIRAVLPRRTSLIRRKAGRATEEQVLAANVDVLFIVTGLDGDFNLRRLERYLLLARESGAEPVVILNKADLCDDVAACARDAERTTGAPVVVMSATMPGSAAQLHRWMEAGATAALAGSSGAGKSTIVNALLGEVRQETSAVRESDSRGRHTTTGRELFLLPQGWLLLDMPGIRELEVWMETASPGAAFMDIESLAAQCRFRDCRHRGEPGCAVADAVTAGALDAERVQSFHKLNAEVDAQVWKRQARIAQRALRQWKKNWSG